MQHGPLQLCNSAANQEELQRWLAHQMAAMKLPAAVCRGRRASDCTRMELAARLCMPTRLMNAAWSLQNECIIVKLTGMPAAGDVATFRGEHREYAGECSSGVC